MKRKEESVPVRVKQNRREAPSKERAPTLKNKKVKIDYSDMEVSEYYLDASKRYRRAKWLAFILLVAFLAVNLLFFRSNITYSNLMYLLRDLDTGVAVGTGEFASISYNEESAAAYGIFKGRLAIASSSGFYLYNSTGARELDESGYMLNPAVVSGNKYAIAYDVGGHSYSVYTAMACVLEKTEDAVIEGIAVSDEGNFAVLTRSDEAKYLVSVYKENLRLQTKYYKDKLVCHMSMNKKGDRLAILSADVGVSGVSAEIMFCKTGTEETEILTVKNAMPLACKYMQDGSLLVLCDTKVVSVADGKIESEYKFSDESPYVFSFGEDTLAVVCSENSVASHNEAFLFDSTGNVIYNKKINEKVNSVCADKGAIYALCEEKIMMYSTDGSERSVECDASTEAILPFYGGLIKCENLGASSVKFG